jgi:hypothetical protein
MARKFYSLLKVLFEGTFKIVYPTILQILHIFLIAPLFDDVWSRNVVILTANDQNKTQNLSLVAVTDFEANQYISINF